MGQTRPTEGWFKLFSPFWVLKYCSVYCYYADETVEKNILDLAARQGQSLYTTDNSAGTLNVNPLETTQVNKAQVDSPSKKAPLKGDFVFKYASVSFLIFSHSRNTFIGLMIC